MEISPVAGATRLMQLASSTVMMKKAAQAQMEMAGMIAEQAQKGKKEYSFSAYV